MNKVSFRYSVCGKVSCMDGWMDSVSLETGRKDGWMDGWIDGWIDECKFEIAFVVSQMYGWID